MTNYFKFHILTNEQKKKVNKSDCPLWIWWISKLFVFMYGIYNYQNFGGHQNRKLFRLWLIICIILHLSSTIRKPLIYVLDFFNSQSNTAIWPHLAKLMPISTSHIIPIAPVRRRAVYWNLGFSLSQYF